MNDLPGSEWKLIATDGEFITDSTDPVPIPGTRLEFELTQATLIRFSLQAAAGYWSTQIGLRIDGHDTLLMSIYIHESPFVPPIWQKAILNGMHWMPPGPHVVEATLAALGGVRVPKGPKEWSPRKTKSERKGCIVKSQESPLILEARVAG